VADAKRWGRPLDTRGSGEHERDFENPSYQIHVYLQEVDDAQWAVLTDGKKWRLYYGPTSHRLDSYYEIDLPTVLEKGDLEDFKYFYLFFRHGAFLEDAGGDCFLDDVYGESNVFAQELGEDLQDNIYDAIKALSEGFLQYPENNLTADDLDLIHDSSLIYLYRLIFVLYAEAEGRELLDTSNEIYEEQYSLNALKQEVAEEIDSGDPKYRDWQDNLQSRLDELFTLIDKGSKSRGIPEEDLYIPAYNGGLFRTDPDEDGSEEATFLANHDVGDSYLAKVIELLTRSQNGNGGGKIFVDYSSLDVRHLGSIYEGLLEYKLDVADEPLALDDGEYVSAGEGDDVVVDEGEVHLSTGSGERKATGSYYTPEYVVEYIVEETLEPLVDDIRADLAGRSARGDDRGFAAEFAERIFDLKILDPAMGSGHFLTSAVDYLAREIIDAQEKQADQQGIETIDQNHDINWARRQVAQRCIYGVDLNPLAVELSKVSLWLRTLAAEQPLAFLDHHLKTGNSLVGSDIEEIEELESESGGDDQNASLADFGVARKGTIEQLMRIYEDFIAIENQELADVKEMESKYDEFERNKLRQRLEALANVHTAEEFGLDKLPSDAYERMAAALEDDSAWEQIQQMQWFRNAQNWANKDQYFHWKLEYPETFYMEDGSQRDNPGFDAIIGNPPWVNAWEMTESNGEGLRRAIEGSLSESELLTGHWDLYVPFVIRGFEMSRENGTFSYILPNAISRERYAEELRSHLLEETELRKVASFGEKNVFEGVSRQTVIPIFRNMSPSEDSLVHIDNRFIETAAEDAEIPQSFFANTPGSQIRHESGVEQFNLLEKLEEQSVRLGNVCYVNYGAQISSKEKGGFGKDKLLYEDQSPEQDRVRFFEGKNIERYHIEWPGLYLDYRPDEVYGPRHSSLFESEKIAVRYVSDEDDGLLASFDSEGMYTDHLTVLCTHYQNIDGEKLQTEFEGFPHLSQDYDLKFLLSVINSKVEKFYYASRFATGSLQGSYSHVYPRSVRRFLIPEMDLDSGDVHISRDTIESIIENNEKQDIPSAIGRFKSDIDNRTKVAHDLLAELCDYILDARVTHHNLNLDLEDYLDVSKTGDKLSDIEGYQPATGATDSILTETSEEREKLKVGTVKIENQSGKLTILMSARYKPSNPEGYDTDQWGYTETDLIPAMAFVGIDDKTESLIAEFVPVAVEEAGGFANFRESATKTKGVLSRLKSLELPDLANSSNEFEAYLDVSGRAKQLEENSQCAEGIIDRILYNIYGLSQEEVSILETEIAPDD
ncbi:Eco57I restriction-modification methylase domain-containing protein, partial [Halobacterium salinarum]|uniref:Eco57I restriction-modification methylase domain-containing protein n=1 Tax=Halobacterium salinarum TaxID=2242 RepID=UPI003D774F89